MILPTLDYASSAFCIQASAKDRDRLQTVFRRAICAACEASRDAQVDPLMDQLNARCLLDCWLLKLGTLAFRCISGHSSDCLATLFCKSPKRTTHHTRATAARNGTLPFMCTKTGRNSLVNRLSLIWNCLSPDSHRTPCVLSFKITFLKLLDSSLRSRIV